MSFFPGSPFKIPTVLSGDMLSWKHNWDNEKNHVTKYAMNRSPVCITLFKWKKRYLFQWYYVIRKQRLTFAITKHIKKIHHGEAKLLLTGYWRVRSRIFFRDYQCFTQISHWINPSFVSYSSSSRLQYLYLSCAYKFNIFLIHSSKIRRL